MIGGVEDEEGAGLLLQILTEGLELREGKPKPGLTIEPKGGLVEVED